MKILINTQILIWYQLYDPKLHANIYDLLTRLENYAKIPGGIREGKR